MLSLCHHLSKRTSAGVRHSTQELLLRRRNGSERTSSLIQSRAHAMVTSSSLSSPSLRIGCNSRNTSGSLKSNFSSSSSPPHHSTTPNASPATSPHHHSGMNNNSTTFTSSSSSSSMGTSNQTITLTDELMAVIRRYFLLIKGKMTAKRVFSFRSNNNSSSPSAGYGGMAGNNSSNEVTYTFSDLAGHGSFIFLALSYLENDFLNLRMYAVSGIALSILFQYYREKPLWIPIRWNSLFLLINAVMIGFLWKESTDAKNLPDDQRYLYKKLFYPRGMSPVEFMHLMSIAKKKELKSNVRLVDERKQNTRVFLVVKGKLSVNKKGNKVGSIHENQFVGAMSFLTWQSKVMESRQQQKDAEEHQSFWNHSDSHINGNGTDSNNASTSIVSPWSNEENLQSRIMNLFRERKKDIDNDDIASLENSSTTATATVAASIGTGNNNAATTTQGEVVDSTQQGQQGYANVITEEDCIVYYWKFNDLIHLLDEHPSLGLVFERCISDDLNRKMTSSWEEEIITRYRQLLTGAISDGEIKDQTKTLLEKFRNSYSISSVDHERMLKELDWTMDDFTAGFKGAPKLDLIAGYETLLKGELDNEIGLTDEARETLREYRQKHGITSEIHLNILRKLGWTLDDFEVGAKDSEILRKRKKLSNDEQLTAISNAVAKAIYAQNEAIVAKQAELAIQQVQFKNQQGNSVLKQGSSNDSKNGAQSSLPTNSTLNNRPVLKWLASWFYVTPSSIDETSNLKVTEVVNQSIIEEEEDTVSLAAQMIDKETI